MGNVRITRNIVGSLVKNPLDLTSFTCEASSLGEAYGVCQSLASSHYENFPVASRLIDPAVRSAVAVVYAFARVADDFADEPGLAPAERLDRLSRWRARLAACASGNDRHPVFWALSDVLHKHGVPLKPFDDLITAFEMDVRKNRFADFDEVLTYCRHSANPVGELVLRLHGQWDPQKGTWSDAICTALQLTNFWQDITVDSTKDRIYIPQDDIARFGCTEKEVLSGPMTPGLKALMKHQVDRTWGLFNEGRFLCGSLSGRLQKEIRLVWLGGTRILEKIGAQDHDVWLKRPALSRLDWLLLIGRLMSWRD